MKKLAIVITHPIQYNAPWFRLLSVRKKVEVKVFYTWSQTKNSVKDRTFGKEITWDIPLLDGYDFEFVENVSKKPGSHHFFGIDCPSLIDRIKAFQPDAILFFGWKFKSHFLAIRYFHGKIPVWFRGDSTLLDEIPGFKSGLRRMVLKKVYLYIDKAFFVGKASKDYFLKHHLQHDQLKYAPHAIDNLRFMGDSVSNHDIQASQWREALGYHADDIVVLFAGKFEPKKQPDFLIRAFHEACNDSDAPLKLLMIGNGPLEEKLKSLSQNDENIQFLPFQNQTQMPLVYRLADIFILPSKGPGETWGLAINEAMASGRPVIVSDKVGCAEDLVISKRNGYVFHHKNTEELVSILKNLSSHDLKLMGENSKNDIQSYNFEAIVMTIEKELESI